MDTHDDRDFEKGGAPGEGSGPTDRARHEQRTQGTEPDDHRERHRRHRRHRHEHRHHGRKERVLHTRVSEQLSDDIRRLAEDLRVPASNLVRNVLEEVFAVVESVSDDMGDLFEDLLEEAEGARERLRERERRGGRRRHRGRARRRGRREFEADERAVRRDSDSDSDVEAELRDDERSEAAERDGWDGSRGPRAEPHGGARAAAPPPEPAFPEVLGWQPLVLNHARACARCGVDLARGHRAFVGLTANGLSDVTLCRACVGS